MQRARRHGIVSVAILCFLETVAINLAPPSTNAARPPDVLTRGRTWISDALLPALRRTGLPLAASALLPPLTPCDAPANAIVAENCLAGNDPTEWDASGAGDPSIQGFATDISVNRGQTIAFKIKTPATNYRLDIYRLG